MIQGIRTTEIDRFFILFHRAFVRNRKSLLDKAPPNRINCCIW